MAGRFSRGFEPAKIGESGEHSHPSSSRRRLTEKELGERSIAETEARDRKRKASHIPSRDDQVATVKRQIEKRQRFDQQTAEIPINMQHGQESQTPMVDWVKQEIDHYVESTRYAKDKWYPDTAFRCIFDKLSPPEQEAYRKEREPVHTQHGQESQTPMVDWVKQEIDRYVESTRYAKDKWYPDTAFRCIFDKLSPPGQEAYRKERERQPQQPQPWQPPSDYRHPQPPYPYEYQHRPQPGDYRRSHQPPIANTPQHFTPYSAAPDGAPSSFRNKGKGHATTGQYQEAPAYHYAQQEQRGNTEQIRDTIDKRQEADGLESTGLYDPASGWRGEPRETLKGLVRKAIEELDIRSYPDQRALAREGLYPLYRLDQKPKPSTFDEQAIFNEHSFDTIRYPADSMYKTLLSEHVYFGNKICNRGNIMRMVLNVKPDRVIDVTQQIVNTISHLNYVLGVKIAKNIFEADNTFDNMIIYFSNPTRMENAADLISRVERHANDTRPGHAAMLEPIHPRAYAF